MINKLNPEPDACYNPNNYKIRNNIESQIQKQHLTRMLNPKPGPCYNPNMQINQMRNNNDPYAEQ